MVGVEQNETYCAKYAGLWRYYKGQVTRRLPRTHPQNCSRPDLFLLHSRHSTPYRMGTKGCFDQAELAEPLKAGFDLVLNSTKVDCFSRAGSTCGARRNVTASSFIRVPSSPPPFIGRATTTTAMMPPASRRSMCSTPPGTNTISEVDNSGWDGDPQAGQQRRHHPGDQEQEPKSAKRARKGKALYQQEIVLQATSI